MIDRRHRNLDWYTANKNGSVYERVHEGSSLAVLMDIRDELQRLNRLLHCSNFTDIPRRLTRIMVNTTKPKPKRRAKR